MSCIECEDLKTEWAILQRQSNEYEKYSLLIKLVNIGLLSAAYLMDSVNVFILFLLLVLWVQDSIWKTYQSRIEYRLLQLEGYMLTASNEKAYQLNSEFNNNRQGGMAIIGEYLRQSIRPTVAFPHIVLVVVLILYLWLIS